MAVLTPQLYADPPPLPSRKDPILVVVVVVDEVVVPKVHLLNMVALGEEVPVFIAVVMGVVVGVVVPRQKG